MSSIKKMLDELRPEFDFTESENFIEDGYLDSFDIVSLISMIEEEYHIVIDGLEIIPENFINLEAIKNLIIKSGGKFEN